MRLLVAVFFVLFGLSAKALTSTDAVGNFVYEVKARADLIVSGPSNDKEKVKELEALFLEVVDTKWMAKFSLGKFWNKSNDFQKERVLALYPTYIANIYVPNFKKYNSNAMKIMSIMEVREGEFLVKTKIALAQEENEVNVDYKVATKKGANDFSLVIFDIVAEGVSLIATQRSEFNAIISSKGVDALIADLQK